MVLTLWTCQLASTFTLRWCSAGTAGVEPAFAGFGDRVPIRWLIPMEKKTAPGFPGGGCTNMACRPYVTTIPVLSAALSCDNGVIHPYRFAAARNIMPLW